jgi:protocatechuate 3,4-dioxygenase beta subunit
MKLPSLTRRKFFKSGLGTLGAVSATIVAGQTLAQVCEIATAEEPLGPFFPRAKTPVDPVHEDENPKTPTHLANDNDLTYVKGKKGSSEGQVVYVKGKVVDQNCKPIPNASIIIWQASESGRYNHKGDSVNHDFQHPKTDETVKRKLDPNFQYWGRTITNKNGEYIFKTVVPGFYPADLASEWYRPPHIHFLIAATGFPQLVTQMYFKGSEIKSSFKN